MRTVLIQIILMLVSTSVIPLFGQTLNEDSVKKVIRESPIDTIRIDALLVLANYQIKHKRQDSIGLVTLQEAGSLAEKIKYNAGLTQVLLTRGNYYRAKNEWTESIESYQQMMQVAELIENDSLRNRALMMANNNLGGIHNYNGDYQNSLNYRLKALEIAEKWTPDNYNNLSIIYLNIASDYRQLKIPLKALEYLHRTSAFFTKLNERMRMEYYYEYHNNYLAADSAEAAFILLGKLEKGLREYDLSEFQQQDYTLMIAKLRGRYSLDYEKNSEKANGYFQQFLTLARELKQRPDISEALYNLGETQMAAGNISSAIIYLEEALDTAESANLRNSRMKVSHMLANAYAKQGNMTKSAYYFDMALQLTTAIYDEERTRELSFAEAKYQGEKKQREIAALTLSNTEQQLQVSRRNRLLIAGGISALALLLILSLLYRSSRQKRIIAEKEKILREEQIKLLEGEQQVVSLQSMINGQESERTRIAKDLHDGLGGLFSTIKMHFSTIQHEQPDLRTDPLFAKAYEMVNSASEELRRIAHNMMPEVLIRIGLVPATRELCNSISAGKLLKADLQDYGMEKRLNPSTEIMLYRIIQELLNNIIKHSQATEAIIQFNREKDRLSVTVEDNGRGFDLAENEDGKKHAGLHSVKSRVNYLNGKLSIDSRKQIGTTVLMEFLINE